jgi:hypothetical protein
VLSTLGTLTYNTHMENYNANPYVQTLLDKGYTVAETRIPAHKRAFPLTIGYRTFQTEEEYQEDLHDFLNGY